MKKIECFKIQLLSSDDNDIFNLKNKKVIHRIKCDNYRYLAEPKSVLADPFLFSYNGTLFLFYESKRLFHPGILSMTSTTDLKTWTKPVDVLKESYHLSYPWVFEENDHIYMVPETSADHCIRLYEATDKTLQSFRYVKTLLTNADSEQRKIDYSDTSIYKKDVFYFLMTTVNIDGLNELRLYVSDSLMGPYTEHPLSPIEKSLKYGRNAGSLIKLNGALYRVAQDCTHRYGDDVHLLEIDEMSNTNYREHIVKDNILANKMKFYNEGGHQFNYVKFHRKYILATDAKEYHLFLRAKILHKLGI